MISFIFANAGLTCLLPYVISVKRTKTLQERARVTGFWTGSAFTFYAIAGLLMKFAPLAYFNGIAATLFWWLYFKNGGGGKTRKRLKNLARKFKGIRRTAPQLT